MRFLLVVIMTLAACGPGGSEPVDTADTGDTGGPVAVEGVVTLPAGFGLGPSELRIATPGGLRPIAADGGFRFALEGSGPQWLDVLGPDGRLVLIGLAQDGKGEVSARTTARALLTLALGGHLLPREHAATLDGLLTEHPASESLIEAVTTALGVNPYVIAEGNEALTLALQAARDAVLPELPRVVRAALTGLNVEPTDVVIEPGGGVLQSGVAVLQNPSGRGLVVQNHFRRPVELLAYEVGVEVDGVKVETTPPKLVGEAVRAPPTGKLELFTALGDVLSGGAPWTPVLSEAFGLPLSESRRTYYELVVLGPTFDLVTRPPLFDDLRFVGEREGWTRRIEALGLDMFLSELMLPLLESFLFGKTAVLEQGKRAAFIARFKQMNDAGLASLGVFLRTKSGLAQAMHLVLDDLAAGGGGYRLDFMVAIGEALSESEKNRVDFEALDARLAARASAATVLAAVQIALTSGDVAAMLKDLEAARTAEGWQATATPPFVVLRPDAVIVHEDDSQKVFRATVRGDAANQRWTYRWSTTGGHGYLSDYLTDGTTLITDKNEVFYQVNNPLAITDDLRDTVVVELFAEGDGPPGGTAVGRAVATIEGRNWDLDSRLVVEECFGIPGMWIQDQGLPSAQVHAGNCAFMSLRFPKVASATSYTISMEGDPERGNLGAGDLDWNNNGELARGFGVWSKTFRVPADTFPYPGDCWCKPGSGGPAGFVLSEMGGDLWLTIWFANEHPQFLFPVDGYDPDLLNLSQRIMLWNEWMDGAEIEVRTSP